MAEMLDRHARQDARAKKVIARERARNEKRKDSLPPFLMVRSGSLTGWLLALGAAGGFAVSLINRQKDAFSNDTNWPTVLWLVFLGITLGYGLFSTNIKRGNMTRDIEMIRGEFYRYVHNDGYTLDFSERVQYKKLMRVLIEHIVKYDPGIFDKMIANPESVDDFDVRNDIIRAQLKEHPEDATKIINMFNREEVSDNLYKKAQLYAKRLSNSEKSK